MSSRSSPEHFNNPPSAQQPFLFAGKSLRFAARLEIHLHPHDAKMLAHSLLSEHGLSDWSFRFDHARRRFGSCRYRAKLITLSRPLTMLNSDEQVRDTLLHEIAHALTPGDAHGRRWKAKCLQIGANPTRCFDDDSVRSPARPPARYRLGCRRCGWWIDRRRLTRHRYSCRRCRAPLVLQEKPILPGKPELFERSWEWAEP
jgi:predicted SprT family Zn-dependent metalloprotease